MPFDHHTMEHPPPRRPTGLGDVFRARDFRLLWSGQFAALLGDQFFLVALPWLVLQLTGDAFAIGTVIAVNGAPRAVFILLGGVLIDRFSPRTIMLYSSLGRMVLVATLAILMFTGSIQLWMLYAFAFFLGLGYALFLPAQSAIVPQLVPEKRLQTGNALIQGTVQLSVFIGPAVAGVIIALLGGDEAGASAAAGGVGAGTPDAPGIALVFALDTLGFLVSAVTLALIRTQCVGAAAGDCARAVGEGAGMGAAMGGTGQGIMGGLRGVFRSLGSGLADVWRDSVLRLYFILIWAVNLALLGSLSVGIPVLAATRFRGGALTYGAILSGLGAGALAGLAAGGVLGRPRGRWFPAAMLGSVTLLGIGLALLGAVPYAGTAIFAAFLVGIGEGYLIVQFITWLQLRTSREDLGRMMSILLFVSVGQAPVSNLIAGALLQVSVPVVMMAAGGWIVLVAAIAATRPSVWGLSENGK